MSQSVKLRVYSPNDSRGDFDSEVKCLGGGDKGTVICRSEFVGGRVDALIRAINLKKQMTLMRSNDSHNLRFMRAAFSDDTIGHIALLVSRDAATPRYYNFYDVKVTSAWAAPMVGQAVTLTFDSSDVDQP